MRCSRQVRARGESGQVYALDFASVFAMAAGMGADTALLADVLPAIESAIIDASNQE